MPTIDIDKIPKEVKDKYSIVSNSFRLTKKENLKDIITTEIGDVKQTEFYPQLKIGRWGDTENDNEVNCSIRLKDTEYEKAKINTFQDKIIWEKDNVKIEYYDYTEGEGGYKMIWYLKEKPTTNKLEFSIQTKGLDFFYQPELTQEEIDEGCIRPEDVVGSYAVYHQNKGRMNDINGKEYKIGKAFHIYRPKIIDAEGKETWGILNIDAKKGIYSVEIPQEFLDKAVYPIKSNDTFGYTTIGGTWGEINLDKIAGSLFTSPANCQSIDSITHYHYQESTGYYWKGVIVLHSDLTIVNNGIGNATYMELDETGWFTSNFSTSPSISPNTGYILMNIADTYTDIKYDMGDTDQGHGDGITTISNNYSSPTSPLSESAHNTNKYSIYATYTPSGGATNILQNIIST